MKQGKHLQKVEMSSNKGGARHFSKPFIESGLLLKVLLKHEALIKNFKVYELLSRNSAVDPGSMVHALEFVCDILELEPQCEIHPSPLRNGLLSMLQQKPSVNNTEHNGAVWVHMRSERINVLLFHFRRLARTGINSACAAALTSLELTKLQDTLKKVALKPLEKGTTPEEEQPLQKGEDKDGETIGKKRKLKVNPSDISLDSQGFPSMLKSPNHCKDAGPSRILTKRVGQTLVKGPVAKKPGLREAMGFDKGQKKKPAAASSKAAAKPKAKACFKKPAAKLKGDHVALQGDGPWLTLNKVNGSKPERAYVLGSKVKGVQPKLIIEVTKHMSKRYNLVLDKIIDSLKKENLCKEDAKSLRAEPCSKYP